MVGGGGGLSWLNEAQSQWPNKLLKPEPIGMSQKDIKVSVLSSTSDSEGNLTVVDVRNFSIWKRLLATMTTVVIFIHLTTKGRVFKASSISIDRVEAKHVTERIFLKQVQRGIIPQEVKTWNLQLDKNQIYRVLGRISEKVDKIGTLIFLSRSGHVTTLMILDAGVSHTLTKLREKF